MTEATEDIRWEVARLITNEIGSVPATFSSLMRSLRQDQQKTPDELSHISFSELKRLLKSHSALCPFLAALVEFKPKELSGYRDPAKAIASIFTIDEICALVACIYFSKQVKKRCDPEEWKFISEILSPAITIAGHLGITIKAIGFDRAILTVCFAILGMTLFQNKYSKEYAVYRRSLKKNNLIFDADLELKFFSCTTREICSLLSQNISFSSNLATEYLSSLKVEDGNRPSTPTHALTIWIESILTKGCAPQVAMDSRWYPVKEDVDYIISTAKRIQRDSDLNNCWLLMEPESINLILEQLTNLMGGGTIDNSKESIGEDEDLPIE